MATPFRFAPLIVVSSWAWAAVAAAQTVPVCRIDGSPVRNATDLERALICEGVTSAKELLAACGLEAGLLEITVSDTMPEFCGAPAHALYDARTDRIRIASLRECVSNTSEGGLFASIGEAPAYRSIAAHETTHAILHAHGIEPWQWIGNKYVAAVAQYSALEPDDRIVLLGAANAAGPIAADRINGLLYAVAPDRFAAFSWLHFASLEDPCAFIRDILSGRQQLVDVPW